MFTSDAPNRSSFDSTGPFTVSSLISTVDFTEPFVFKNEICTAPFLFPSSESRVAPTAKSFTPSPSKSPMFSTDQPYQYPFPKVGPFVVESLISTADFTAPSSSMNKTCTAPRLEPPASSKIAPTAKSS